jgi:hypothetical protein
MRGHGCLEKPQIHTDDIQKGLVEATGKCQRGGGLAIFR